MVDRGDPHLADGVSALPARSPVTLLVLSHLRWDFVFQRPQQLLTRAARDGLSVIYVEEPVWEGGTFGKRVFERDGVTVVQPIVPAEADGMQAEAHARRVVAALGHGADRLWLWLYTPMALPWADDLTPQRTIFDKMDELSAFAFAPPELLEREAATVARADVVFTGGAAMFEAAAGRHANLHCFPSSIDAAHFGRARDDRLTDPADQAAIARPRIGFFGVIDERFDAGLLAQVAARRPDWQFVMLGPTAKIDPAALPRPANVHWLGAKAYEDLPAYLAHWDAGWMPFAINDATRFISPTKTPEFLAAGLPLVSTAIRDVVRPYGDAGLVRIAGDADASVAALEAALRPPAPGWRAAVDTRLATGSWDQTWARMRGLIEAAVPAGARELAHV